MIRIDNIKVYPPDTLSHDMIAKRLGIDEKRIISYTVFKRSVDARKRTDVHYVYTVDAVIEDEKNIKNVKVVSDVKYVFPKGRTLVNRPLIVGSGPSGLFAALMLAEAGYKPVLIEQGQDVDKRTELVKKFWSDGKLNPLTNVQFGEGGAGTFSDGKLNTGIKNIRCRRVLEEFVRFGAPDSILFEAKPHVGTDYLTKIVKGIRERIIECGGEVRFGNRLVDISINNGKVCGAEIENNDGVYHFKTDDIILCIGHSAHSTFKMLHKKNISMQKKAFSVGVRIEHKQEMINKAQYGGKYNHFQNADYKLVVHLKDGRGVYTFCMCPGGFVVNSASDEETIVTNGMSYFDRSGENANSAVLVSVLPDDIPSEHPLSGIDFQKEIEKKAFISGGGDYTVPCQKVGEFLGIKTDASYPEVLPTVKPGVKYCDISEIFPEFIVKSLKEALPLLDRKLEGFANPEAVLSAPETRSSSPVTVLRDKESFESVSVRGLYPCGEGAGYAGGIMSAAVDGIKCAEAVIKFKEE